MATHAWELSKENVQPTKAGRSMAALTRALAASEGSSATAAKEARDHAAKYVTPEPPGLLSGVQLSFWSSTFRPARPSATPALAPVLTKPKATPFVYM